MSGPTRQRKLQCTSAPEKPGSTSRPFTATFQVQSLPGSQKACDILGFLFSSLQSGDSESCLVRWSLCKTLSYICTFPTSHNVNFKDPFVIPVRKVHPFFSVVSSLQSDDNNLGWASCVLWIPYRTSLVFVLCLCIHRVPSNTPDLWLCIHIEEWEKRFNSEGASTTWHC